MAKIMCTKGTLDQMLSEFKSRIQELEGIQIDSSFDYPDDLIDLENGEYESHAADPVMTSEDSAPEITEDDVLDFLSSKGYDTSDRVVRSYAEGVCDYLDMCKRAWEDIGQQSTYTLQNWYDDTARNYPDELADLPTMNR